MSHIKLGATINEKHTYRDWDLVLTGQSITGPVAKTAYVDIPGRKTRLDATESMYGGLTFQNRTITLDLYARVFPMSLQPKESEIMNAISGKRVKVVLDTEPDCYWLGRAEVQSVMKPENPVMGFFTIAIDAEPYRHWSGDLWPWDSFSFTNGVIPIQKDVEIAEKKTLTLPAMYRPGVPTILSDADMKIATYLGSFRIKAGETVTLNDLVVYDEPLSIAFTGNGHVTVTLSGESL